jgi:NitT/TauT family transport system substrate-binding protein
MRIRYIMSATVLALAAAACSAPAVTPGGGSPGVGSLSVIVPDSGNFTSGMPVYVAIAEGFFKKEGISVTVVNTTGGATNVAAAIAGKGSIGVDTGPVSVLSADLHGANLKILAADTTGMDILFFAKKGSGITSIRGLAGKAVGYSSPGSSSEVALGQVNDDLKADGLAPATGEAIGGPPQEYTAVETGQVAAGFTAAPNLFSDVEAGGIKLLTSVASYPAYSDVAVRVIFGSGSFIAAHPRQVQGFLTAWRDAWAFAFANHVRAMTDWKDGANLAEPVSVLESGFNYYNAQTQRLLPLDGLSRDVSDAVSLGLLKSALSAAQIAAYSDISFAAKVPAE